MPTPTPLPLPTAPRVVGIALAAGRRGDALFRDLADPRGRRYRLARGAAGERGQCLAEFALILALLAICLLGWLNGSP